MKISSTPAQLKHYAKLLAGSKIPTIMEIADKRKTEKEILFRIKHLTEKAHISSATNAAACLNQANALRWVLGELN